MATIDCQIVTPSGAAYQGPAEMVVVPGAEGELGVLARHAPLIARLKPGEVRVRTDATTWTHYITTAGYFQVQRDVALILVENAVVSTDVDTAAAQADAEDARRRIEAADAGDASVDRARAELDLVWAETRMRVGRPR